MICFDRDNINIPHINCCCEGYCDSVRRNFLAIPIFQGKYETSDLYYRPTNKLEFDFDFELRRRLQQVRMGTRILRRGHGRHIGGKPVERPALHATGRNLWTQNDMPFAHPAPNWSPCVVFRGVQERECPGCSGDKHRVVSESSARWLRGLANNRPPTLGQTINRWGLCGRSRWSGSWSMRAITLSPSWITSICQQRPLDLWPVCWNSRVCTGFPKLQQVWTSPRCTGYSNPQTTSGPRRSGLASRWSRS